MPLRRIKFARPIIILLLMSVAALAVSQLKSARADSFSAGLDGVGSNISCGGQECSAHCGDQFCAVQSLSTTKSNDAIILAAECGFVICHDSISSIIDSNGLSFTQRVSYSPNDALWEFSAIAPAPLTGDRINVTYSGDYGLHIQVIAIAGVDPSAIFDPDPSVPATVSCATNTQYGIQYDPCSLSIHASQVAFVIALVSINDAPPCTVPSGFTQIMGAFELDYEIVSTPGDVAYDCSNTDSMSLVMDAIALNGTPSIYQGHEPIVINGDSGFTASNGVTGGSGTSSDPYKIDDWYINGCACQNGIDIRNTDAYFVIQNVYLHMHPQTYFGPAGIAFSNVTNGVVIDSRIEGFWYGISTSPGGNFIPSSNLYISGNSITDTSISNSGIAIFLRAPTNVEVSDNYVSNDPNTPISGVYVLYGNNVWVEDNTFLGLYAAISFGRSTSFLISGNHVQGSRQVGISIDQSSDFQVTYNQVSDSSGAPGIGILVGRSSGDGLVVSNNTIVRNDVGISIESSRGVYVSGNTVDGNGVGVIADSPYLGNSGDIAIVQNEISNNGKGVVLHVTFDSVVYQNNFDNNYIQAIDTNSTNNSWDNGYPSGGNFWSDFTGVDNCSGPNQDVCPSPDGIGDTPYMFSYNQDNYPLMNPYSGQ